MQTSVDPPASAASILRRLFDATDALATAAALEEAARRAREQGLVVLQLGMQAACDDRELAQVHAAIALQAVRHGRPASPTVILSAGPVICEGSAAAQFLLALAHALDGNPAIYAYASGRDAIEDELGGWAGMVTPDTARRAAKLRAAPAGRHAGAHGQALLDELGDGVRGKVAGSAGDVLRAILLVQE